MNMHKLLKRTCCLPDVLYCCKPINFFRGVPYVNTSRTKEGMSDYYVNEKAPRTAVVIHENGTLSLMQVRLTVAQLEFKD